MSESTIAGPLLHVRGFPFLGGRTAVLHKRDFKSNILCKRHNNALSCVDQAGTDAFNALRDALGPAPPRKRKVDGNLFERWLLKTLINTVVVSDFTVISRLPCDIVEIAFGKRPFGEGAGLYFVGRRVSPDIGEESISATVLHAEDETSRVVGGRFGIRGFEFLLLWTPRKEGVENLVIVGDGGSERDLSGALYRPHRFNVEPQKNFIAFSWR